MGAGNFYVRDYDGNEKACIATSKMRGKRIQDSSQSANIIWATIGRAYDMATSDKERERIQVFAGILHTGVAYDKNDRAAIVLRDYLKDVKTKAVREHRSAAGGGGAQETTRTAVINAIYFFMQKKEISKLTSAPKGYLRYPWEKI